MDKVASLNVRRLALVKAPAVGNFLRIDHAQRRVVGLVLRSDKPDLDGDKLSAEVVQDSQKKWAVGGGCGKGIEDEHGGPLLKNSVFLQFGYSEAPVRIGGAEIPAGCWFAEVQVSPETMSRIEKGELRGFSVEGSALVRKRENDELFEVDVADLAGAIVGGIKQAMGVRHASSSTHRSKPATCGFGRTGGGRMFSR